MKRLFYLLSIGLLLLSSNAQAQAPPGTDIYLANLQEGYIHLPEKSLINLTHRDGYDNQPFFTPDGRYLLYTSNRDGQTDIYRIDLKNRHTEQVTKTPESEYSPTVLPSGDGFSTIRVEADETQRLWRFDMDGTRATLLFEDIKPVGYQAWINENSVAMFILGQPPTLQFGNLRSGKAQIMARAIGRSLHHIPGSSHISFVHKKDDDNWVIQEIDPETGKINTLIPTLKHQEDYAWTPDGGLLMADGAILYRWTPDQPEWAVLYDFGSHGLGAITRIAVSPDGRHIALVADR